MQTHTAISHQSPNLFSAEQVAKTIGADLETVNEWLGVGAIDRAVFGGGQFSKIRNTQSGIGLRTGEMWNFATLRKRNHSRNGIRPATNLGKDSESLQSLRDSNSNKQKMVSFVVLEEIVRTNRPAPGGRPHCSARFRHPGPHR